MEGCGFTRLKRFRVWEFSAARPDRQVWPHRVGEVVQVDKGFRV